MPQWRPGVLNAWRWVNGAPAYRDDLVNYRRYLISHEFGHALGTPHEGCPAAGELAPVMMRQTKGSAIVSPQVMSRSGVRQPLGRLLQL